MKYNGGAYLRNTLIAFIFSLLSLFSVTLKAQQVSRDMRIVKDFADYNLWANRAYAAWLGSADSSLFHQELESSFNTLAKTVAHLWNAERGWLNTLAERPWGDPPSVTFEGAPKEMLAAWLETSEQLADFVRQLPDEQMTKVYNRSDGAYLGTAEEIMLHVFNHATYHRGQLITMGRQLGLPSPPRSDYIFYIGLKAEE
ncbi:MAG: DinB family protein [Saprospiraceae bacterium]